MKKNILKFGLLILIAAAMVGIDRITKIWAVNTLMGAQDIILIPGVLQFHYLENFGMAFGMFQNQQIFFYIMTALILAVMFVFLAKMPLTGRFLPMIIVFSVVSGGAVGNLIDRITTKYVVDFIYFSLVNFPIFNFADICVSVGCVVLIILLCFVYKDEELKPVFTFRKNQEQK